MLSDSEASAASKPASWPTWILRCRSAWHVREQADYTCQTWRSMVYSHGMFSFAYVAILKKWLLFW